MKIQVKDKSGADQGEVETGFKPVPEDKGQQAVHDTVVAYNAARRSGTASTKTVAEVSGSGKKPWRQKGTGRARVGYRRNPIWRGGGVAHGPKPRDYFKKVNKKVHRLALRKAFTERVKAGKVLLLDGLELDAPKTGQLSRTLNALGINPKARKGKVPYRSAVLVVHDADKNLFLSARNIQRVISTTSANLNTYWVLWPDVLVFTKDAYDRFEERLNSNVQ